MSAKAQSNRTSLGSGQIRLKPSSRATSRGSSAKGKAEMTPAGRKIPTDAKTILFIIKGKVRTGEDLEIKDWAGTKKRANHFLVGLGG